MLENIKYWNARKNFANKSVPISKEKKKKETIGKQKKIDEKINLQQQKIDDMIQNTVARYGWLEFILIASIQYRMPHRWYEKHECHVFCIVLYRTHSAYIC